jgi:hypothetical protein
MALTDSIKTELYQFFSVAFNAAPGVTYMSQLADAVNAGATVKDVVNVFTTKAEFTASYPTFFTNAQFAAKLVDAVVGGSASTAAKDQAKADVAAALESGMSRGDVIYTVFSNLAAKPETDPDWAGTAKQMANKVVVAKYYTEDLLTDSTNLTTLRAVIANVTDTTDVSSPQTVIDAAFPPTNQTFTLTTNQDRGASFTGGAGQDTFDGIQGTASTYNAGDSLDGGNGADTLTVLLRADPASVDSVALRNIETVQANVQATDATGGQLDASTWTGVQVLSNEGSTGATLLSVSGLALDTLINAEGNTDVTVAYRGDLAGSADTVSVMLDRFGTGTGTTTTDAGTLTIGTGIETLNVAASGTAYLTVEAGDTLRAITVSATEAMTFVTDELLTSFNAAGLTKTSDFTFNGTSDLAFVGGAGNDTVRLGTNLSNADSIDGGSGIDTVRVNLGADRSLQAVAVERLVVNFTNSTADLTLTSAQSITEITVSGGGFGGGIVNFVGGTVNLVDNGASALNLDTVSGASVTLVVGGTAQVDLASARVADAASVTINSITASAGEVNDFTNLTLAQSVKTLNVTAQGSAGLNLAAIAASGLESLNVVALGSAAATVDATVASTALESLTVRAIGSSGSDVTLAGNWVAGTNPGPTTLSFEASAGASITAADFNFGSAATGESVSVGVAINVGEGSDVVAGGLTGVGIQSMELNVAVAASATATIGALVFNSGTEVEESVNISASVASGATLSIASLATDSDDLNLTVGAITVGEGGRLALFTGNAQFSTASIGVITVQAGASADLGGLTGNAIGTISLSVGSQAAFSAEEIDVSAINGLNVTIALEGSAEFADIVAGAGAIGDTTITLAQSAEFDMADMSASAIGVLSITVGTNASAVFDDILATGGAVSGLNIVVRSAGEFVVDDLFASALATSTFGVGTAATAQFADINVSGSFGKMFATGAGALQLGAVSAGTSVAVDLSAFSGTFSASFATMTAGVTVTGGPGTMVLNLSNVASAQSNSIVLATATGTDTIRYSTAITDTGTGVDEVVRFELGSGGDVISLGSALATQQNLTDADGVNVGTGAAANASLSVVITGATTLGTADNVIRLGTAFANTAAMLNFLTTSISFATSLDGGSGALAVLYTTDAATASTMLALVKFDGMSGTAASIGSAGGTVTLIQSLANFTGTTAGSWTGANVVFGG